MTPFVAAAAVSQAPICGELFMHSWRDLDVSFFQRFYIISLCDHKKTYIHLANDCVLPVLTN